MRSGGRRTGASGGAACAAVERADRGAPQGREVRPAPERCADVGRQHPHVGTPAADDAERGVGPLQSRELERIHVDRSRRSLDRPPGAGLLVELPPAHLHGRIRRGDLPRVAHQIPHRATESLGRDIDRRLARDGPVGVERVGLDPEPHRPLVGLGEIAEEPQEPRGAPDAHQQQPGGHRIQGPGVTDLPRAERPPNRGDRIVGRDASRLVDQDQAVGARGAHGATVSPFSARTSRSTVPAGPCFEV